MEPERAGRMEHLALASRAALKDVCVLIHGALLLPEMQLDFENETEWDLCEIDGIEYNVSRPYHPETLHEWDPSVPEGCNVGVTLAFDRSHPHLENPLWITETLVPQVAVRIAKALHCTVHHHRTWLADRDEPCATRTFTPYTAVPE